MGGGKSQKGGKHGTIGRTLAHDILYRQQSQSLNSILVRKENSVYERNDLDEYIIGKLNNLEQFLSNRKVLREVKNTSLTSELLSCIQNSIQNSLQSDENEFPEIPVPRRIYHFTTQEKVLITKLNREREKNNSRKYFKRRNKKIVDQFMHGHLVKSVHTPRRIINRNNSVNSLSSPAGVNFTLNSQGTEDTEETVGDVETPLRDDSTEDTEDTVDSTMDTPSNTRDSVGSGEDVDSTDPVGPDPVTEDAVTETPVTSYINYVISESKRIRIENLSVEEWDRIELRNFYKWRSILSEVELREKSTMTPYEKNLEFWRQLWRVIERSHLVLIILDARDPLFFRVKDLENYIKQINQHKHFILVLNKADFLTEDLRTKWAHYFKSQGVDYLFFSTLNSNSNTVNSVNSVSSVNTCSITEYPDLDSRIYNVELLLERIKYYKRVSVDVEEKYVVGFVGYPNVGKSSLINCLMESTRTCVGTQPGKTKHIQTLPLKNSDIILCDCPGLIFPNLVSTKYHLLINSIISTAHFKGDMTVAVQLICNLIPHQVCKRYDIDINQCLITLKHTNTTSNSVNNTNTTSKSVNADGMSEGVRVLYSVKVLEELCKNRNYISAGKGGQLDHTRAAKLIINDFTQGHLLYCKLPPTNTSYSLSNSIDSVESGNSVENGNSVESSEGLVDVMEKMRIKTLGESKQDEDNVNKWLKQQIHKEDKVRITKRKMRFLIKGKRKNPS